MGISSKTQKLFKSFSPEAKKRLIKMGWSDKVSNKEIEKNLALMLINWRSTCDLNLVVVISNDG